MASWFSDPRSCTCISSVMPLHHWRWRAIGRLAGCTKANTTIWTAISPVNCSIRIFRSSWHLECNLSGKTRVFSFTYGKNLELIVVAKGSTLHSTLKHYCLRKTKYFENLPNRLTENTILRRNSWKKYQYKKYVRRSSIFKISHSGLSGIAVGHCIQSYPPE